MNKDRSEKKVSNDAPKPKREKKKFNIFAFALCFVAAFFIWVYAVNTQNNNYTKTFSINIEVINEAELLQNKKLSVFGLPEDQVSITIQGTKADVQKYSEKDFRAYVDLLNIEKKGTAILSVNVETPSSVVSVIATEPKTITVYADEMRKIALTKEMLGAYCKQDDSFVFSIENQEAMSISGPKTYVDKIASVKVVVPYNRNYKEGDNISLSNIELYDKDNEQLSILYITVTPESFVVKVEGRNG